MPSAKNVLRNFGRDSAHRKSLLRNLVASLLEHGKIVTTLEKAKTTAILADKAITAAKKGTPASFGKAHSLVLNHSVTMPLLFTKLRERYAKRQGGYTRIIPNGVRAGDGANSAILELVDSPGEIRFEMTARELGRKYYIDELANMSKRKILDPAVLDKYENWKLKERVEKCLKFRPEGAEEELISKAEAYRDLLRAEPAVHGGLSRVDLDKFKDTPERIPTNSKILPVKGRQVRAGELLPAMAIYTPRKPTPFKERHDYPRLPFGRRMHLKGKDLAAFHQNGPFDPVAEEIARSPSGEFMLARTPLTLARGLLGKKRLPVKRFGRNGDGLGG
ncbi:Mitochondrial/chloroplast ribosomal protein L17 [Phaffia rhodozyma]|uniref:Mitochondrial/chloroplast ribosomal protein L17 n=1 Tax=Phaffia rhodozyma TaxID=264483 RepID=A0A0F7STC5_PHARH|nr:Mitochondrial/chloroplast ribosomal protein L17 [Phaffia rhodozyma]